MLETWLWNVSVGVSHFQCCVFVVASKFIYCAYLNICQLRENIYIYIYIYIYYYYYYYSYYYYYMNYFKSKIYLYSIIQNFFLKYSIFFYTCNKNKIIDIIIRNQIGSEKLKPKYWFWWLKFILYDWLSLSWVDIFSYFIATPWQESIKFKPN